MKKRDKFDIRDYAIIKKSKVYVISPKNHNGIYNCDLLFVDSDGKCGLFKPIKSNIKDGKVVYKAYRDEDIIGDYKKLKMKRYT